jgi:signal peptidase II
VAWVTFTIVLGLWFSVTDFMHINFVIFETGIFNVADVSIMVGMGLILFDSWYKNREVKDKQIKVIE